MNCLLSKAIVSVKLETVTCWLSGAPAWAIDAHRPRCCLSTELSPASAWFLLPTELFPGSRGAALAGARPELLTADRVRAAGGCAVSRLGPWIHQADENLQEHPWPLLLVAPTLPGDLHGPQRGADGQHHPSPCSPAIPEWLWLAPASPFRLAGGQQSRATGHKSH